MNEMNKVKLVYHSGYWDGPLSGVCMLQGKRRWFKCVHDYHSKTEDEKSLDMRIYAIYNLTEEEWRDEDYWHGLFEKNVGTHTSYDENGCRSGKVHSSKTHNLYYNKAKEERKNTKQLTDDKLVGYFDRFEMKFRATKYRDYWLEGESPFSTHDLSNGICSNHDMVEWRTDAQKWDDFDSDFDGKSSGWAICIQPDGPDTGKSHWLIIKHCPWCGNLLSNCPVDKK